MTVCCNTGANTKLALGSTRVDFIEFDSIRTVQTLSDGSIHSIRGRLDHDANMVAEGILYVDYRLSFYLMPDLMAIQLPMMGFINTSGNNWYLGDTLPSTNIILGPSSSPEVTFGNSVCGKWILRGQKGADPPRIDMWFRGMTRDENPVNTFFVSQTSPPLLESYPYSFTSGVLDYAGSPYAFNQCALGVDYGLVAEWNNSVTATNICPTDHDISIGAGLLYSTCDGTTSLVTTPFSGDVAGGTLSLEFSRTVGMTSYSTTFSIGNVKLIANQPRMQKHDFWRYPLQGRGYSQGTAPALQCVNVG